MSISLAITNFITRGLKGEKAVISTPKFGHISDEARNKARKKNRKKSRK